MESFPFIKVRIEKKMISDFDQYWVLYTRGLMGTWISWLINQHKDFPGFTDLERWDNGEHHTFNGCWWMWIDNEEPKHKRHKTTYQEHIDHFVNKNGSHTNKNWKKLCSKTQPDHGCMITDEQYNQYLKPIKTKGIIIPYIKDKNYGLIDMRNQVHGYPTNWHEWLYTEMYRYEKYDHAPIHYVDCGALLDADEKEYHKLLMFIEQAPIDNWKKECQDALEHTKKGLDYAERLYKRFD